MWTQLNPLIYFLNIIIDNCAFYYYSSYNIKQHYCCSKQLHYQQKLLENKSNKISENLNITIYSKYTQLWIINNYKKLTNNKLITL